MKTLSGTATTKKINELQEELRKICLQPNGKMKKKKNFSKADFEKADALICRITNLIFFNIDAMHIDQEKIRAENKGIGFLEPYMLERNRSSLVY